MFCPSCNEEFRSGFTRCESCGVDLVHELSDADDARPERVAGAQPMQITVADYCGFFTLEEAREARGQLKAQSIYSDIVIRESDAGEEYWLRVDSRRYRDAHAVLPAETVAAHVADDHASGDVGDDEDEDDDHFTCSECGGRVAAQENFCPGCGARFEES